MSKNNLTTFYIVRHGESESNANSDKPQTFHKQWGEFEAPLTELGKKQAEQRRKDLQHVDFDAAFSSDLTRAKQTAEIIALERKLAIQTTKIIRERDFYRYVESTKKSEQEIIEEMKQELAQLDEKAKVSYKHGPSMESSEEGAVRLITFVRETAVAYAGKTVLIVCHGNLIRSFLTHIGYAQYDELPSRSIDNTAYVILESDGVDFFIKETHGLHKQQGKLRVF